MLQSQAKLSDRGAQMTELHLRTSAMTRLLAREKRLRFVMRELDHRTKNLLAVVQSIAMQTAQHSKDLNAFRSAFSQRIGALSRSLDLLVRDGEPGVSVTELVQRQLEPFTNVDKDRIVVGGPNALLNQEATQTLGLALHELATNATKYGALSVAGGRISVTWDLAPCNSGAERFRLIWREENGPPVAPPTTRGFGTVILNHVGASVLSGNVQHDFDVNGVRWSLDVPASACLVADKAFRAAQHSPVSASTHAPSVRATRYIPTLSVACGLGHDRIGD